jgi:hypothetical protein
VQDIERHVAELDPLAVLQDAKGEAGLRRGMQRIVGPDRRGQLAASRSMIGMEVSIDDQANRRPGRRRGIEVGLDRINGIDDRRGPFADTAGTTRRPDLCGAAGAGSWHCSISALEYSIYFEND